MMAYVKTIIFINQDAFSHDIEKRKLQLIAGSTYTVSLPKEWVLKNGLKEKKDVLIYERNDKSLVISAKQIYDRELKEITLDVDEFKNITSVLFSVYYLGIEVINLTSKTEISREKKAKIRRVLSSMSGTEISYEDKKKIILKVLIDKFKVDVMQIIYRVFLLIDLSLSHMFEEIDLNEVEVNEIEIDRLYHLLAKVISLSLTDAGILESTGIKNVVLVPSYLMISKKLENLADNINSLLNYLGDKKIAFDRSIIDFIRSELERGSTYLIGKQDKIFEKFEKVSQISIKEKIKKIKDIEVSEDLNYILRHIIDIEEDIVTISFYKSLINKNQL
jgi:phosphate uptake regulator